MKPHKKIKNRKRENTIAGLSKTVAFLIIGCLVIGILASVGAKYVHETKRDAVAVAKVFYFTSDLLDGGIHEIAAMESDGTASVTFQLMNHADDLRCSEVDIDYEVTVKSEDDSDDSDDSVEINSSKGTIQKGSDQNALITLSKLAAGKTYIVTAKTSNTYQKVLSGKIKVQEADNKVHASLQDKTNYIELTVWSVDYSGNITIQYADSLIPDNTDDLMTTNAAKSKNLTINNWGKNTAHVFRFFKESTSTSKNYDVTVKEQEVTVSEK